MKLNGGTFNLLVGRDSEAVRNEVERLTTKHNLDFLNVQEARTYTSALREVPGFQYFTGGNKQTGVLVKGGLAVDKVKAVHYGDGWWTVKGKKSTGSPQVQVRLDGWLLNRSIHLPTPSHWRNGHIVDTPAERKDDLIADMRALRLFFTPPRRINAAVAGGDWNEQPGTVGDYSPHRLAVQTGSHVYSPRSREGHGHIDWFMAKGCFASEVFKDTDIRESSDHEPVIVLGLQKGRRK